MVGKYINYFLGSVLINNDFSNSDITLAQFAGTSGGNNNFNNVIKDCITLLEGHANEEITC